MIRDHFLTIDHVYHVHKHLKLCAHQSRVNKIKNTVYMMICEMVNVIVTCIDLQLNTLSGCSSLALLAMTHFTYFSCHGFLWRTYFKEMNFCYYHSNCCYGNSACYICVQCKMDMCNIAIYHCSFSCTLSLLNSGGCHGCMLKLYKIHKIRHVFIIKYMCTQISLNNHLDWWRLSIKRFIFTTNNNIQNYVCYL